MPDLETEIAILGAGCAGLSAAVEILSLLPQANISIFDSRQSFDDDRTWCFFETDAHRWAQKATAAWRLIEVKNAGQQQAVHLDNHAYCCLPASTFYDEALRIVSTGPNTQLVLGAEVSAVSRRRDGCRITAGGQRIQARLTIDARNRRRWPHNALLQHFVGWELEATRDCFDPNVATLMDFDCGQRDGIEFLYVLPFSGRRALVEATILGDALLPLEAYRQRIRDYLADRWGLAAGSLQVLREEKGVIPMSADIGCEAWGGDYLQIGIDGGAARPSSGYAFAAIQRQAAAIANHLAVHGALPNAIATRPRYLTWMDRVFLRVLQDDPRMGPQLFSRLASALPDDRLARFMSDAPRLRDLVDVVMAMPKLPFIQKALGV